MAMPDSRTLIIRLCRSSLLKTLAISPDATRRESPYFYLFNLWWDLSRNQKLFKKDDRRIRTDYGGCRSAELAHPTLTRRLTELLGRSATTWTPIL